MLKKIEQNKDGIMEKNNFWYAQQGDILIEKCDKNINGEKLNHLILAHGESGHQHEIVSG